MIMGQGIGSKRGSHEDAKARRKHEGERGISHRGHRGKQRKRIVFYGLL
jgi:hypothetical protein